MKSEQLVPFNYLSPYEINFSISKDNSFYCFHFQIQGESQSILIPPKAHPERKGDLWTRTCFELFLKREDDSYFEINCSPTGEWASWLFESERKNRTDTDHFFSHEYVQDQCFIKIEHLFFKTHSITKINPSVVVKHIDGSINYFTFKHPPQTPNFHDQKLWRVFNQGQANE